MDSIAALQDLKAYRPAYEKMLIEFPDRALLERVLQGIEELMAIKERMDVVENRMFEVERTSTMKSTSDEEFHEIREKSAELEGHLERMSNILQMLNTKVEKYFSKSAEAERQETTEGQVKDLGKKVDAIVNVVADIQARQKEQVGDLEKDILKMEEDIDRALRRLKRLERHFVDVAKSVEE
jgi:chromosome segregation ATPase